MSSYEPEPGGPARASGAGTASPAGTSALLDTAVISGEESFEAHLDVEGRPIGSTWRLVARRFFGHRIATISLVVLLLVGLLAAFASVVSPYEFNPPLTSEVLAEARQRASSASSTSHRPPRSAA
jgi:hypothetical protein